MKGNIESSINFKTCDLRKDIGEKFAKSLYSKTGHSLNIEAIDKVTESAINELVKQGNDALYQALVLYGAQIAEELYIDNKIIF